MDLDAYGLSDLSQLLPSSIEPLKKRPNDGMAMKDNLKQSGHIAMGTKAMSTGDEHLRATEELSLASRNRPREYSCMFIRLVEQEKQRLCQRGFSSLANLIENVIEQFIPHSDVGRQVKEQIYTKKNLTTAAPATTTLPLIK